MSIPGAASPLFLATTAGAAGDFEISRSLRFNSADSAYLNRTPSSASNRKTFTWSGWVKKSASSETNTKPLFAVNGGSSATQFTFRFDNSTDDTLRVENNFAVGSPGGRTVAVFRDFSGWMHVVLAMDTTQANATSGLKIYVNGVLQTLQNTVWTQNIDTEVNTTNAHFIGTENTTNRYFDGYLADVNFIDGQALDPTSFGAFDDNGVWQAIDTAGLTFGTNGFRLKFADNSSNAALGTDSSGNSNTWTVNNLTTAAGLNPTAQQNFDVVTYTGNGGTQSISSLAFQPDFVWIKNRTDATSHMLFDSVRGVQKVIYSNATTQEQPAAISVTAFNSNGFTVGSANEVNGSGDNMVAWAWKAGGAASSNTDGSITSSVSANTSYGFSIVSYTGDGSGTDTIGHGLNAAPSLVITKSRGTTGSWRVFTDVGGTLKLGNLNNTDAFVNATVSAPTSSVFSIDGNSNAGTTHIAYCWSEVAGFSKFGTVSTGSDPVVVTGFKPRFLIVRRSDTGGNWNIFDTERSPGGTSQIWLEANNSGAENNNSNGQIEFLDNGFKLIGGDVDPSGGTAIYAAFAATLPDSAGIDSLVDTPSNAAEPTDTGAGGEVVGNYATLNPLNKHTSNNILSNGNLEFTTSGSDGCLQESTIGMSSGKFYFEVVYSASGTGQLAGIRKSGSRNYDNSYIYTGTANKYTNAGSGASYGATLANGDVIGTAFDADNGTLTFYKNGVSQGTAFTGISGTYSFFVGSFGGPPTGIVNFGQRAFAHTAPSGYKALCTTNLPTPTIADGSQYFDTKLWTGDGSSSSRNITGLSFSPDFVFIKNRSSAYSHTLYDQIRGVGPNTALASNTTGAEGSLSDGSTFGYLSAFNSNGFSIIKGSDATSYVNGSGQAYVAWAWDAGTSTVTNNDGSVASQVRAQPSVGFSIVTYTGSGSSTASYGHGLNAEPHMIIVKRRDSADNWYVYFKDLGNGKYLNLNTTSAAGTLSNYWGTVNNTVFSQTYTTAGPNNGNQVAYCFAPVAGYSAMGSYTGNGSTDGPFVYTGFRPSWILIKNINDGIRTWDLYDSARGNYNPVGPYLFPNASNAESNSTRIDILSNGFKLRTTSNGINPAAGHTMIYAAFAENPFQANGGLAR